MSVDRNLRSKIGGQYRRDAFGKVGNQLNVISYRLLVLVHSRQLTITTNQKP